MGFTSDEIRGFVDAVRGEPERGECVTRGTVTRVDPDGTAWVQIGQNAEPTPCGMDVSARVGDVVTVRIADHRATVTGNSTSPATDDRTAMEAHGVATAAKESAEAAKDEAHGAQQAAASAATTARSAETAAQEAKQAARSVNQHFWDDTRGAHVTEAEMDAYVEEPSGFQNLMTSIGNIFTKAVDGVERILRSDTASGMVVYDGECAPDARDLASHAIASFTSDGATIGKESSTHTSVTTNSMSIMYGTDRLVSVTSDGTTASVYMGASTAAPGCKYTDAKVVAYRDMFNSGYRIVPEPDASGRCAILDPDGHTSEFFAVKDTSPYSDLYDVKDPDGDDLYSGMYSGIFSEEGHEDHFYLSHKLNPAAETPGPVDIEGGNVSFHAEDGAATVTGSVAVTDGITTQGDVADATGTLDQVRQDGKNAGNITSGTLPVARGGTGVATAAAERNRLGLGNTTGALPIANGGTGATTASDAVKALTGRAWDFNTANTTDTWVPVAATKNGAAVWQHRAIPAIYCGQTTTKTSYGGDVTIISASDATNKYKATRGHAAFLVMNADTGVNGYDLTLTAWQASDNSLGVRSNKTSTTIKVGWILFVY